MVRKRRRIKNELTNVILHNEKLNEKSSSSKILANINLACNEIENSSVNIDCKKEIEDTTDCDKNHDNSVNVDCKEEIVDNCETTDCDENEDKFETTDSDENEDKNVNIDCKEIDNNSVCKNDEIRVFKKNELMPSKIPLTYEPIMRTQSPTDEKIQFVFTKYSKIRNEMCEICGVIIRRTSMENHMNVHLKRKPFLCDYKNCGRSFTSPATLFRHKKLHTLSKDFTCDICSAKFHFNANLRKHKESHLEPKFKCMICERMFKTVETLKAHSNKHKESENLDCTFSSCDKKLKNSTSLREHLRRYHNIRVRERVPKANECDLTSNNCSDSEKAYSNGEVLKKIKIEANEAENINIQIKKNQMCTVCGITIRRDNMKYHMNTHLNQKPFVCTYKNCGKSFASRSTLYNHRRLHTTIKNFKCDICSATFHFNGNLQKHKAIHLEATYECTICNRTYKSKDSLKYHMYSHKETEAVVCTYPSCNKIFSNQNRVNHHLRRFHKIKQKGCVSRPNE